MLGALGIRDDRDGALLGRRLRELGAVPVDAADRDERLARPQVGGREGDARERDARGVAAELAAEALGEFGERSARRPLRAENGRDARGGGVVGRHGASMFSYAAPAPAGGAISSQNLGVLKATASTVGV